jgi:hypothetical protein
MGLDLVTFETMLPPKVGVSSGRAVAGTLSEMLVREPTVRHVARDPASGLTYVQLAVHDAHPRALGEALYESIAYHANRAGCLHEETIRTMHRTVLQVRPENAKEGDAVTYFGVRASTEVGYLGLFLCECSNAPSTSLRGPEM